MALVAQVISQEDKKGKLQGKHNGNDNQAADCLGMIKAAGAAQGFQLFEGAALVFNIGQAGSQDGHNGRNHDRIQGGQGVEKGEKSLSLFPGGGAAQCP